MKLKVYILAANDRVPFAKELLEGIEDLEVVSERLDGTDREELNEEARRRLKKADVVAAVIDREFGPPLWSGVRLALEMRRKGRDLLFLPILAGRTDLPPGLNGVLCLACDPGSEADVRGAQEEIRSRLRYFEFSRHGRTGLGDFLEMTLFFCSLLAFFLLTMSAVWMSTIRSEFTYPILSEADPTLLNNGVIAPVTALFMAYFLNLFLWRIGRYLNTPVGSLMARIAEALPGSRTRRQEAERSEFEAYSRRLEQGRGALPEEENGEFRVAGLLANNLWNLEKYNRWARGQARHALLVSALACLLGFILFVLAARMPPDTAVSAVLLGCGVLLELLAGAALLAYRGGLARMDRCSLALRENQRFLTGISLLGHFSPGPQRDEVLLELIRSQMRSEEGGS